MTYPYGMYGAPRVGNGLGGLPRRTVAVAATPAAGPEIFQRIGSFSTVSTSAGGGSNTIPWGRKIGVNEGKVFFKQTRNDGSNQNFTICGASYSDSGVTGALSESNFGTTPGFWSELSFSNSWTSGDSAYYYDRINNQIVRVSAPTTAIVRTTVKSTAIPTPSTFTVGGNSYTVNDSWSCRFFGDNTTGNSDYVAAQALSNGGVLLVRFVVNNTLSTVSLAGFVFDSSWNLIRSFPIRSALQSGSTNIGDRGLLVLPVTGSTSLFSVFSICSQTGSASSPSTSCATFDWTTGTTTALSDIPTFSTSAAVNWFGNTTYLITSNSLQLFFNDSSSGFTRRSVFLINSDFSVVNNGAVNNNFILNPGISNNNFPVFKYYDPEFRDFYSSEYLASSFVMSSPFNPVVTSFGSSFFSGAHPTIQQITNLSYSTSSASASISTLTARGITAIETDDTSIVGAPGAGPTPTARVASNAYIGVFYDQASSVPSFVFRAQLMRTPS